MSIGHMRLLAQGDYTEIAQAGVVGSNDMRGALLVFMASSRNAALADACVATGFIEKLKTGVSERVYMYLWAHMHKDFMWLVEHDDSWKKAIASAMPWKIVLAPRFHKPEWNTSLEKILEVWEPTKLNKYPSALKYMVNPSERHILESACGKDTRYMNTAQVEAVRPGASQWFKMRKELGIEESHNQASQAFRHWWNQGGQHELDALESGVFLH
jgi:hypothetical protein